VGSAAGGLDVGTIANGTYHVYLIKRPDTLVVDALFSRNPDRAATITVTIASPGVVTWTGHGLQAGSSVIFTTTGALPTGITAGTRYFVISAGLTADAFQFSATEGGAAVNTSGTQSGVHTGTTGPVMPTNYTFKRRIGSILREAAAIAAFVQDGDFFQRKASVLDVSAGNPGTSAVTRTLSVPIGYSVRASFAGGAFDSGSAIGPVYFSDLAVNDEAPATATAPLGNAANTNQAATSTGSFTYLQVRTNNSAQIRSRLTSSNAGTTLRAATYGWFDVRGKED
jgi:hypothetical protein